MTSPGSTLMSVCPPAPGSAEVADWAAAALQEMSVSCQLARPASAIVVVPKSAPPTVNCFEVGTASAGPPSSSLQVPSPPEKSKSVPSAGLADLVIVNEASALLV